MDVLPVTLEGEQVRLEPLSLERHFAALCEVALDPELWRWTQMQVGNAAELRRYLETALREQAEGRSLPFATVAKAIGKPIGSTRFGNIEREHRRVEIGWTWIGRDWQRTAINTEAKLLMLTHAFERWGVNRVELKTDALNQKSRAAIRRIGGVEEGIFRKHMVADTGRIRDTAYYSITNDEWPAVKARLEAMRAAPRPAAPRAAAPRATAPRVAAPPSSR